MVFAFEQYILRDEATFMKVVRAAAVVWLLSIGGLWVIGQVGNSSLEKLRNDYQSTRENQLIDEVRIDTLSKRIEDIHKESEATRALAQQLVSDQSFTRGIVLGVGGLMTFLQFLTVMAHYRSQERRERSMIVSETQANR